MANLTVVKKRVSPLPGQVCRPYTLGGAADVGDVVYLASDGQAERTDASSAATAIGIGVVTAIGTEGATTGAAGDRVSVQVWGPCSGFGGITAGTLLYTSDDAGKVADAPGTVGFVLGRGDVDDTGRPVLFINPAAAALPTLDDLLGVTITTPTNGQVLKYNGTAWVNGTDAT